MARKLKKDQLERLQPKPPEKLQPTTDLGNLKLRPTPAVPELGRQEGGRNQRLLRLLGLGSALVAAGSAAAGRFDIASGAAGFAQGLTAQQEAMQQQQAAQEEAAFQRASEFERLRLAQEELALRRADILRRAQESEEERALRERELQQRRELTEKELQTQREIAVLSNASRYWGREEERTLQAQVLGEVGFEYLRDLSNTYATMINLQQQGQALAAQDLARQISSLQRAVVQQIEQLARLDPVRARQLLDQYRHIVNTFTRLQMGQQGQQNQVGR